MSKQPHNVPGRASVSAEPMDDSPENKGNFQSEDARKAAEAADLAEKTGDVQEPKSALVGDGQAQVAVDVQKVDGNREVVVRPLKTISRLWFGREQYSLVAGKKAKVPLRVANILRQKGVVA